LSPYKEVQMSLYYWQKSLDVERNRMALQIALLRLLTDFVMWMFTSCWPLKSCCCYCRNRRFNSSASHVLDYSLALQTITLARVHLSEQRSWIKLPLFGTVGGTNLSMFLARQLLPSLSIGSLPSAMFSGVGQGRSRQSAQWETSRPRLTWESQHTHTHTHLVLHVSCTVWI